MPLKKSKKRKKYYKLEKDVLFRNYIPRNIGYVNNVIQTSSARISLRICESIKVPVEVGRLAIGNDFVVRLILTEKGIELFGPEEANKFIHLTSKIEYGTNLKKYLKSQIKKRKKPNATKKR